MALRGVLTHRKTRRLARLLGISQAFALGVLEAFWHVVAEHARDGGVGRTMTNADIADEMFHDGDADELIASLISAGWIDEIEDCRLFAHGWDEYSDDTTDNWLARHGTRYANGSLPRMKRLSDGEKERLTTKFFSIAGTVRTTSHRKPQKATKSHDEPQNPTSCALPEPVPEPVPESPPMIPPLNSGQEASAPGDVSTSSGKQTESDPFPVDPGDPWWDGDYGDALVREAVAAYLEVPKFAAMPPNQARFERMIADQRKRAPNDDAIRYEFEQFSAWHRANRPKYTDGIAAFRTWFSFRHDRWSQIAPTARSNGAKHQETPEERAAAIALVNR